MSGRRILTPAEIALGAGVAGACAIAAAAGLVAIATPPHFDARLATAEQGLDLAARKLRTRGAPSDLPADAVCRAAPAEAAQKVRADLTALAAASRLELLGVEATAEPAGAGPIAPIRVRFEATGPYEGATGALAAMSGLRPVLFVDTVDLVSRTSAVTLVVSGRMFCSAAD